MTEKAEERRMFTVSRFFAAATTGRNATKNMECDNHMRFG